MRYCAVVALLCAVLVVPEDALSHEAHDVANSADGEPYSDLSAALDRLDVADELKDSTISQIQVPSRGITPHSISPCGRRAPLPPCAHASGGYPGLV